MAEPGIRTGEAPKGAPETARIAPQGGWRKAITAPLHMLTGILTPRYQSTFEPSQAQAPAQPKPSLWNRFTGFVGGMKDSVVNTFSAAATSVKEKGLLGAAGDLLGRAWDGVKDLGSSIVSGFSNIVSTVTGAVAKVFEAFTKHQRDVELKAEEVRRDENKREERRLVAKTDEARQLEDTAARAKAVARALQFQAQQGLIDKITESGPHIQIDNAALERQKQREKAQKAL
ncbi:MAG: hypothetical protein FJZ01_17275 [Candidatus Sericytochromatia bacterium]|nr:hypothetical protein [Candidatus Tanganyikabacteria bacterium]